MRAIFRVSILVLLSTTALTAAAGDDLDATVNDHVLSRFDEEARGVAKQAGAQHISSRWDAATHTLIALAEMPAPPPRRMSVAYPPSPSATLGRLESYHLDRICGHPAAALIEDFLREHGITMTFVYTRPHTRLEPLVVTVSHTDLAACP